MPMQSRSKAPGRHAFRGKTHEAQDFGLLFRFSAEMNRFANALEKNPDWKKIKLVYFFEEKGFPTELIRVVQDLLSTAVPAKMGNQKAVQANAKAARQVGTGRAKSQMRKFIHTMRLAEKEGLL